MDIGVTGGSGFIGSRLARELLAQGHQVHVLDLQPSSVEGAGWIKVDITQDAQMVEATKGMDVIYHLAAISNVNHAFANPLACIDVNLRGTACVLEAARQNKLRRVIFASSVWVYQAAHDPTLGEESPFLVDGAPHLYTMSKIAGEMLCNNYRQLYGVPTTILRYGIPYGPHMRQDLLLPIFIRKALHGEPLTISGDGKQFRKFIYIDDLVSGNIAALSPDATNTTFNLEGLEAITVVDIAEALNRLLGGVSVQFTPARPGDFAGVDVNGGRAEQTLGWKPQVLFQEGLSRTLQYFLPIFGDKRPEFARGVAAR